MKKVRFFIYFVLAMFMFGLSGCSGVHYEVKPTPLKSGKSTYSVNKFDLTLDESRSTIPEGDQYLNQEELKESFIGFFTKHLKEQKIYGDEYKINVKMLYQRIFYFEQFGGNSIVTPNFQYYVEIVDSSDKLIASYSIPMSNIKRSVFVQLAHTTEQLFGQWDHEDEPIDIEFLSKIIVKEIKKLGK
ncbi:MAG: hypothetical protein LBG67_00285 [Campylobacteraceae bacterium]|jgi:hypothetical protein|nr:hypothetical protein [Campylobacteraceae bacterium]